MEKLRILVVDDNTVNLATVEQELEGRYEVIPMISGRRAIKFLFREKVDLILLDVQMPVMDGIQTLQNLREQENSKDIPVILLTAKKDKETVLNGSALGIMDYITKPFDGEDLQERIEKVFLRMGKLDMGTEELEERLGAVRMKLQDGQNETAMRILEDLGTCKLEGELLERIESLKWKVECEQIPEALAGVSRIINMLKHGSEEKEVPASKEMILQALEGSLTDIEAFELKSAIARLKELRRYELPKDVELVVFQAYKDLTNYDDDYAQQRIQTLLKRMT